MIITGQQIRQGRILLKLDQGCLAKRAKVVTKATLIRAEAADGEPLITVAQARAIRRALERAGIEFLPQSGCVRLRDPDA